MWARARRADEAPPTRASRMNTAKGVSKSHGRRRAGRRRRPARSRERPECGPGTCAAWKKDRPRMTRTGGASTPHERDAKGARGEKTRGARRVRKTARAQRRRAWVPVAVAKTPERDGPEAGNPRTARRDRHTSKGRERAATTRETPRRSVRRAQRDGRPIGRAGDEGNPASRPPERDGERSRAGAAPNRTRRPREGRRRRTQGAEAHASPKSAAGSGGQANTPATSRKSSSRKVAIE